MRRDIKGRKLDSDDDRGEEIVQDLIKTKEKEEMKMAREGLDGTVLVNEYREMMPGCSKKMQVGFSEYQNLAKELDFRKFMP